MLMQMLHYDTYQNSYERKVEQLFPTRDPITNL